MRSRGFNLVELMAVLALAGILLIITLPTLASMRTEGRVAAGAREIAMTFHALRWKSVARNSNHGLLFERLENGWAWFEVRDGNGNGLRSAELRSGIDQTLSGPHRLEDRDAKVGLGFPPADRLPVIPPRSGAIGALDDPVKFGRSDLVSFSPLGSASSGTVYLTDGRYKLYAVVLFGPTARVRVWRYDVREEIWKL
jgi:prepilin-type N-terminal cleavage/methylation domain-containing protein